MYELRNVSIEKMIPKLKSIVLENTNIIDCLKLNNKLFENITRLNVHIFGLCHYNQQIKNVSKHKKLDIENKDGLSYILSNFMPNLTNLYIYANSIEEISQLPKYCIYIPKTIQMLNCGDFILRHIKFNKDASKYDQWRFWLCHIHCWDEMFECLLIANKVNTLKSLQIYLRFDHTLSKIPKMNDKQRQIVEFTKNKTWFNLKFRSITRQVIALDIKQLLKAHGPRNKKKSKKTQSKPDRQKHKKKQNKKFS